MRRVVAVAALAALLSVVGACASADDQEGSGGTGGTIAATSGQLGQDRIVEAGEPTPGGTVTMALEAETDGWDPTLNRWAASGAMVGLALYDPLTALDDEGVAQPYLAESLEPDDEYRVWTITLRPDVTFHDGTPVTSADVVATMEGHLASALTRPALGPLEEVVAVDERTIEARMSMPWVAFPQVLTAQAGVIPSLTTLEDPDGARNPIGSGPFRMASWEPGNEMVTERFEGYWRTDEQGRPLPYLDGVTFRPIEEGQTRLIALTTGEVDVLHTSTPTQIVELEDQAAAGDIQLRNDRSAGEKGFVMFNLAVEPFDDPDVRRLLVQATDVDTYNSLINQGAVTRARSVFPAGSPYHSEEAEEIWPEHDPAAAAAAVEAWEAENGPLAFTLIAPPTTEGREAAQLLQQQWGDVGVEVQIESLEQTAYLLAGVQGQYEAILWRQFGAPDPDTDAHWWLSENASDVGSLALNFARIRDDEVDAALEQGRTQDDADVRTEAYQELAVRFNELIPYLWVSNTRWVVAAGDDVHQFWNGPLPDGQEATPISSGVFRFTHTWVDR